MTTADEWLYARVAASGFLERYPQYAAVLAHLAAIDDPATPVMAVSSSRGRFYLHVNRAFFDDAPAVLAGILLHEIHHIVLGHVTHPKFRGLAHPPVLELAMEMSANEGIREPLPPHVTIEDYARLGVRPGQSTLERYELLLQASGAGARLSPGATVDDHGPWAEGLTDGKRDEAGCAAALELARVLEAATLAMEAKDDRARDTSGRLAGRSAADLVMDLDDVGARPIDWRLALRAFVARRRDRSFDYRRPNRRFLDRIGEVPGRARRQTTSLPPLVIAIDTSASMSRAELSEIAAQLDHVAALAKLIVVECDADIQRTYPYEGELSRVHGRGGTDLRPVFEPAVLRELDARGVIYFTDGEGPYPAAPPHVPTLWVLTKGDAFACPWGARVSMRVRDR